ncbi:MAG: hypothetical protein WCP61_08735 [Chitinophagia bacterium]|jgi:hypothetical protein
METKIPQTHWKKLTNPKYVGSHDLLPGQELQITFDKVVKEMVKNVDGKEEMCVVAYMKGAHKPLIMNKTNMKIVTKVLNTPYIEEWIGKSVTIYSAKVKAFGEVVDAIRVKAK